MSHKTRIRIQLRRLEASSLWNESPTEGPDVERTENAAESGARLEESDPDNSGRSTE